MELTHWFLRDMVFQNWPKFDWRTVVVFGSKNFLICQIIIVLIVLNKTKQNKRVPPLIILIIFSLLLIPFLHHIFEARAE